MRSKSNLSTGTFLSTLLSTIMLVGCANTANSPKLSNQDQVQPNADLTKPRLGAVGIGVSDLSRSTEFYQQILGLAILRTYELGYIEEVVLGHGGAPGAVLVLMHWPDQQRAYAGGDVKNVFYVADPQAVIEQIRALGGKIDREAEPHPALDGRLVGLARDPDNYVVEVIQEEP